MSFLVLILVLSGLAYLPQLILGHRRDYRMAMRHGLAGGLIFTGIDHFLSTESRYVPMMPQFLSDYAVPLIYLTGAAEIAGAIGLVMPLSVYRQLGLPNLRRWAGIGLALLLTVMVIANINVAVVGTQVEGLPFGRWYYWLRPFLQPIFVVWALLAAGVIGNREVPEALPSHGWESNRSGAIRVG